MSQLFRTKSIDALIAASEDPARRLRKTLGPWSLTALGIGAVIGSGIFILTGTAAAGETLSYKSILHAPVLDLLMHGSGAVSTMGRPGAGSGDLALVRADGHRVQLRGAVLRGAGLDDPRRRQRLHLLLRHAGRDLRLDHRLGPDPGVRRLQHGRGGGLLGLSATTSWRARSASICRKALAGPMIAGGQFTGSWFNLPALVVLLVLTVILVRGVRESAETNNVMVLIKLAAILIFVFGAARAVDTENWQPFMPNGFPGVLTGAAIVFFTYIGFDSVSTAAEECRNPQRDLPIGIIATLVVCTVLYTAVALVLTGHRRLAHAGQRRAGGQRAEGSGLREHPALGERRRHRGHGLLAAGLPVRAGAGLVRHVARRPAARGLLQGPPGPQDAAHQHLGGGAGGGHPGRASGTSAPSRTCRTSARCSPSCWSRRA